MINLISKTTAKLASLIRKIQLKSIVTVLLIGLTFLTTGINSAQADKIFTDNSGEVVRLNDAERPQTSGQWNAEANETEDAPLERAKRIVGDSAEAVKDWAELYPDVAQRTIPALKNDDNK